MEIENNKYEDEAFVRDFPQKLKMEDEKWNLCARYPLENKYGRWEHEILVRDIPQVLTSIVGVMTVVVIMVCDKEIILIIMFFFMKQLNNQNII